MVIRKSLGDPERRSKGIKVDGLKDWKWMVERHKTGRHNPRIKSMLMTEIDDEVG